MVYEKMQWIYGNGQQNSCLLTDRNRRLDKYNNRPPFKKFMQNVANYSESKSSDIWKVNVTTKKTGEYTFYTNFQHKAYVENLPSYRQGATKLPKIPYLSHRSKTPAPSATDEHVDKRAIVSIDNVKLVNLKFESVNPSKRCLKQEEPVPLSLFQIQDQIADCERKLRSRSTSARYRREEPERENEVVRRNRLPGEFHSCSFQCKENEVVVLKEFGRKNRNRNVPETDDESGSAINKSDRKTLSLLREFMGNLQHRSSTESCKSPGCRNKFTSVSSDERFFKKSVLDKKKYFEKTPIIAGTKMITDCNHILKTVVTDTIEEKVQNDYHHVETSRLPYSSLKDHDLRYPHTDRPQTVPQFSERNDCRNNRRNSELFNPDYNFDKCRNGKRINQSTSLINSIKQRVLQHRESSIINDPDPDYAYDWEDTADYSRFPRETRNAVASMMSSHRWGVVRANTSSVVPMVKHSETQTSPVGSNTRMGPAFKIPKSYSRIPCPKNLLCERGLHVGKCGRVVTKRSKVAWNKQGKDVKTVESVSSVDESVFEPIAEEPFVNIMEPRWHSKSLQIPELASGDNALLSTLSPVESSTDTCITTDGNTMNGLNGHTNGELHGCGDIITQNQQKGCWTIGLINSKYRYLTAETFGFKINANGTSLKKKQVWTLEPDVSNSGDSLIYLRSHLDKYLAVDSFGNVTCESEEKEPGCKFQISVAEDGSGRWALRNVVRGYFLGSSLDKLTCTAKVPSDSELWHVHLAARPQVNLRSVGRKRFAHLSENLDEIHVDANIPWGEDTLFTLEFRLEESGKYAIHTCNNKYLSLGGKLVDTCTKDCLFSAEYHSGQLALRDRTGAYLSPIGSKAVLKTRSQTVTKDELFSLEDSLPQASFVAALNNKFVSVKQGVDVTANQDEISDHETFQLEFDWNTKRWYIRTMQDRYWTLETGGGIQAAGDKRSSNALFDLLWQGDGSVAFRANNGRYVITKRSGHLYATSDSVDDNCKYFFYLVNRPILVLKCEQGFVGHKSASSTKLECNKATYETIQVERAEKGVVYFKGQNGKYWHVDSEGVTADSDTSEGFYLELREPTRLCIKSVNGNYLTASKNGCFRLGDTSVESATQWEY